MKDRAALLRQRERVLVVSLACLVLVQPASSSSHPSHLSIVPARTWQCPSTLAAPAPLPAGSARCLGVRPGAAVASELGVCTLNFLFEAPDGTRFVGTAGHCIVQPRDDPREIEESWPAGLGPPAWLYHDDGPSARIGEFAYAVYGAASPRTDFALIRLDPSVAASPKSCYWGGPTGIDSESTDDSTTVRFFGQGLVLSRIIPARTGVILNARDPHEAYMTTVAAVGDSGAGIMSADGRAFGVISALELLGLGPDQQIGDVIVTRLGPVIERAAQFLQVALELRTAPAN